MNMSAPPYKKIGSLWLPGGGEFEVWSNYAIAVPHGPLAADYAGSTARADEVCLSSEPFLPIAYLPQLREMFAAAGLIGDLQWLHWVGRQTEIEHVCTCFGILEPSQESQS